MKNIITIVLFYLINFPLWDLLVAKSMPEEWASFTVYSILFLIIIIWNFSHLKGKFKDLSIKVNNKLAFIFKLLIIIGISYIAMNILFITFDKLFNINILPENTENIKSNAMRMPKLLTFIMMTIFAPIIEEYVFRESFIGWIDKDNKTLLTLFTILSIIMFDMIHVINLPEFIYYVPLTLSLTYVYLKNHRNVAASIFFHSLTNALAFLMILIGQL